MQNTRFHLKETHVLILVLVLAFVLRVVGVGSGSLWTDEFHTLSVARAASILSTGVPYDQHPPLYYLLMQGIVPVNSSEFWLRLPSVLFGMLGIVFMWRIGYVLGNKRLGLLAASLYAFSPLLVWYSREARMYGMASFLWAASLYFYFRTLYSDGRLDFLGLMLTTLTAILTTYSSIALWFLQIAFFYWFWQQAGGKRTRLSRWQLPGPLANLIDLSGTLQQTLTRALVAGIVLLIGAVMLSIWITIRPLSQRRATQISFAVSVGVLCMLGIVTLMGLIQRGLSIRRQLLVLLPPFILLAAWVLSRLHRRWLTTLFITLILAAAVGTVTSPPYENWRAAIDYMSKRIGPSDVIVSSPPWNLRALDYYFRDAQLRYGANDDGVLSAHVKQVDNNDPRAVVFTPSGQVWLLV